MFLGRNRELTRTTEQLESSRKATILVYGKRRVGKSTLILNAIKNFEGVSIYHTFSRSTFAGNLELLSRSVCAELNLPPIKFQTIFDLFDYLNGLRQRICLVLDEYQYFKETLGNCGVDSFFQTICDNMSDNIKLIFCGSYISVMKELLQEDNPLFGRFSQIIYLKEMDYYDAAFFVPIIL